MQWAMRLLHDDLDRTTDHQKEDWAKIGQIGEPQESVERDRFSPGPRRRRRRRAIADN